MVGTRWAERGKIAKDDNRPVVEALEGI